MSPDPKNPPLSSQSPNPLSPDLVAQLYAQLRAAAQRQLAGERANHTLSATALVHEAYLRLAGPRDVPFEERAHFYAAAVEAMRRVLIDHARARGRDKRDGGRVAVNLDEPIEVAAIDDGIDYLALDEAINELSAQDARVAEVVSLRLLCGLGVAEVAQVLGVSERTVKSDWAFAHAWLTRRLGGDASAP